MPATGPGCMAAGSRWTDGPGATITTAQDIRARVDSELKQKVVLWVYQDACPPSNGCTVQPPALSASGTPDAEVWQYAQSPRRKENTAACAKTYARGRQLLCAWCGVECILIWILPARLILRMGVEQLP